MPITFLCACGRRLTVPDALALKQARCPACDMVVNVPSSSVEFAPPPPLPSAQPADAAFRPAVAPARSGWSAGDAPGSMSLPEDPQASTIFVLGLLGLLLCCLIGIPAILMGNSHRQRVARGECRANGMATAGWVLGIVSVVLPLIGIIGFFVLFGIGALGAAAGG